MDELHPQKLFAARYRLIEKIGAGGFSEVWKAVDEMALETAVALKIYAPDKGLDKNGIKQFRREYALTQPLENPYLLKANHFAVEHESPFLVMPLCERGSLQNLFFDLERLDDTELARLMEQIGSALAYLHAHDILHQDIKPDNILINRQGDYLLTDFGISVKMRGTLQKATSMSQAMTLAYSPPERYASRPRNVPAGDIFAFGVMLYELASGEIPWSGHGGMVLLKGAVVPDLPEDRDAFLNYALKACMHPQPGERPLAQQVARLGQTYLQTNEWANITELSDLPLETYEPSTPTRRSSQASVSSGRVTQAIDPDLLDFEIDTEEELLPILNTSSDSITSEEKKNTDLLEENEKILEQQAEEESKVLVEEIQKEIPSESEIEIENSGTDQKELLETPMFPAVPDLISESDKELETQDATGKKRKLLKKWIPVGLISLIVMCISAGLWKFWPQTVMIPVQQADGDWGFLNTEGELALPYQFDAAGPMANRRAVVRFGEGAGIVDATGNWVHAPVLEELYDFSSTRARAKSEGKYGFLDPQGDWAIPPQYYDAEDFIEGKALVENEGRFGFIDSKGNWDIAPTWEYAESFSDDLALVSEKGLFGFIDKGGSLVIPCKYEVASSFHDGRAMVIVDGLVGYLNPKGELQIPAIYHEGTSFSEDRAVIRKDSLYQYIDVIGNVIGTEAYEIALPFHDGRAQVFKGGGWAFINVDGARISESYQELTDISKSYAIAGKAGKSAYIDATGGQLSPWCDEIFGKYEGRVRFRQGSQYGYLDERGQEIISSQFDEATDYGHGRAWVKKNGKYAMIDQQGELLTSFDYEAIRDQETYLLIPVKKDGAWYLMRQDSATLIPGPWMDIAPYACDRIRVRSEEGWTFLDAEGQVCVGEVFEEAEDFQRGKQVARVRKANGQYILSLTGALYGPYDWVEWSGKNDRLYVSKKGKVALATLSGDLLSTYQFDEIAPFKGGLAKVRMGDSFQYLKPDGFTLSDQWYEEIGEFEDGLAWVKKNRLYGMIDQTGKEVFAPKLERVEILAHGYASIREDGKYSITSRNGKIIHRGLDRIAFVTEQGVLGAAKKGKYGLLSILHGQMTEYRYQRIYPFSNGLAETRQDGLYGFLNTHGAWAVEPAYDLASPYMRSVSVVEGPEGYGTIDRNGNILLPAKYTDIGAFDQERPYSWVEQSGKYALLDLKGHITSDWYDEIRTDSWLGYVVKKEEEFALIDQNGQLLSAWYDEMNRFVEGKMLVKKEMLYGFINQEGEEIIPCEYSAASPFLHGKTIVRKEGQNFFMDETGAIISEKFEDIERYFQGFARIRQAGRYGYMDEDGKMFFDSLKVFVHLYGVDIQQEYTNTRRAISTYFQNAIWDESWTQNAAELEQKLEGKALLLLPEFENGQLEKVADFAPVYQHFVKNGGTILMCGSSTDKASRVFETGLLQGEFLGYKQVDMLTVEDRTNPLAFDLPLEFRASNATYYYLFQDADIVVRLADEQAVVATRPFGKGKVVYVGFDFYEYNLFAARLISNVFRSKLIEQILAQ